MALVIFNHTSGYTLYQYTTGLQQVLYMILTMITRINVPLFFMISGALLLTKEEDYRTVIKKRISRFILLILTFEAGLVAFEGFKSFIKGNGFAFNIVDFILQAFSGKIHASYWYLYAYLGFLFSLPFMQRIAKGFKKQDFFMLIALHFVLSSLIPMLNILFEILGIGSLGILSITRDFSVPMATVKAFFYPLLGYYLEHFVDIKKLNKMHLVYLTSAAAMGILLSCACTYYEAKTTGQYTQNYVQLFDYITAIAAFLLIKYFTLQKFSKFFTGRIGNSIRYIGSLTLGMYLLDPYFRISIYGRVMKIGESFRPMILTSFQWVFASMCIGGIITAFLKKLPILKKIL